MIRQARKVRSRTLAMFGPASIWTGVSSFAFHASYTYVFQIFDYFGMFCFVNLALVVNMRRSNTITADPADFCVLVACDVLHMYCSCPWVFQFSLSALGFWPGIGNFASRSVFTIMEQGKGAPIASQITSFTSQVCGTMPKRWVKCRSHLADFYRSLQTAP